MTSKLLAFLAVCPLLGLFGTGCVTESFGEPELLGTAEGAVASSNRLSMNRLSMNRLSMNGLSQAPLTMNGAKLVSTGFVVDEAGRELLTYVARCALTSEQSLTATFEGETYTFKGALGLAPEWLTQPLTNVKAQRWVSACLLAHVNGYGIEVPISLRGAHPALKASAEEKAEYSVQETVFYGNVFESAPDSAPKFYSCGGATQRTLCGDTAETFRPFRSCGDSETCALVFVGACKAPQAKDGNACRVANGVGYSDCHNELTDAEAHFPDEAEEYKEIITVYLRPAEWNALYASCEAL